MMYNGLMCDFAGTIQNLPAFAAYVCAAGVGVWTVGACAFWISRKLACGARRVAAISLVGAVLVGVNFAKAASTALSTALEISTVTGAIRRVGLV